MSVLTKELRDKLNRQGCSSVIEIIENLEAGVKSSLPPKPSGVNEFGVDMSYFYALIERELSDLSRYKRDELARVLARMSYTADPSVMKEAEFNKPEWEPPLKGIYN